MLTIESNYSSYLSVVLAWHMSRVYGNNEPGAIRKCARRIRDKTKNEHVHKFCRDLVSCGNDSKLLGTIGEIETVLGEWRKELKIN